MTEEKKILFPDVNEEIIQYDNQLIETKNFPYQQI